MAEFMDDLDLLIWLAKNGTDISREELEENWPRVLERSGKDFLLDDLPLGALPIVEASEGETTFILCADGSVHVRTTPGRHLGEWLEPGDDVSRVARLREVGADTVRCLAQGDHREAWFGTSVARRRGDEN